ncbi:MAG: hypothetical protein ACREID_08135, partial [Planctomycetota bacterium]
MAVVAFAERASPGEPLETLLAQPWRWREVETPSGRQGLRRAAANGSGALVAAFVDGFATFDGYAWTPV